MSVTPPHDGSPVQASDGSLLERFRRGDDLAFAALVERHERPLLATARVLLGAARATRLAEDLVQDAFLKLARKPPVLVERGVPPGSAPRAERARLAAWLNKVARNRAMELLRSEARRKTREAQVGPAEAVPGDGPGAEVREAVLQGLAALPDDQREALVLRLLHGLSYREIAEATGRAAGTVGWLISEGLRALEQRLAPAFELRRAAGRGGNGDAS